MKHRTRLPEQDDLLRPRLTLMIDLRLELVKLTALIGWEVFEREWAGFFPSTTGRPATPPRLVAGVLYLLHAYRLSDEAPPTSPSAMQRANTVSKSLRNWPLSRKRPWRFFEKAEWSGIRSVKSRRQNQR